ncbi:MAG: hypothetical protein AAGA26_10500 [Pseudomonadota bacterium]
MTNEKKQDQVSDAGAVELEEGDLDQAHGGANFLKLDGLDGQAAVDGTFKFFRPNEEFKVEIEGISKFAKIKNGIRK